MLGCAVLCWVPTRVGEIFSWAGSHTRLPWEVGSAELLDTIDNFYIIYILYVRESGRVGVGAIVDAANGAGGMGVLCEPGRDAIGVEGVVAPGGGDDGALFELFEADDAGEAVHGAGGVERVEVRDRECLYIHIHIYTRIHVCTHVICVYARAMYAIPAMSAMYAIYAIYAISAAVLERNAVPGGVFDGDEY